MKIKFIKAATVEGVRKKAGTTLEAVEKIANKLIERGYAALDDGKVEEPEVVEVDENGPAS